ncbi:DUF4340 domain-containing protein [Tunicatimonas pelagia]|uniref:DUF4340 domain-containing protein n=1 Tax=Tunicatimonas pelagia TaxID=931531 RepID=UPI002665B075|nr:DUF4340 domain-containing protein [Tunicatimonas pelagia]WKN42425.1 DUF4340 domain-containing protein [Tunicatimonas pelagia]
MHKPYNNRILSITFGVLLVLYLVTQFTGGEANERNFRTDLVTMDTATVDRLVLNPKEGGAVTFTQKDSAWQVAQGDKTAEADQQAVQSLLGTLLQLEPQRLAARSEEKWNTFEVTDSLGSRVQAYNGENLLADVYVGKFSLQQLPPQQPMQPGMPPMQQQRPKATSYVRLADEAEVYAVDGFLTTSFNQPFNSWRDRNFLQLEKENISRISFQYPADSSFTLALTDSIWTINGTLADSAQTAQYLNQITRLTSSDFADDFNAQGQSPSFQARIEGNNMNPVTIEGYQNNGSFVLRNSLKPDVLISSDSSGLYSRVFKGKENFVGREQ